MEESLDSLLKVKALLQKAQSTGATLQGEIAAAENAQAALDAEALAAAALEERGADKLEKAAQGNKARIVELRAQLEQARAKAGLIEKEVQRLEGPAVQAVKAKWRDPLAQAVKEFYAAAQHAATLEARIQAVKIQASDELGKVTARPLSATEPLPFVLLKPGDMREYQPLERYRRACADAGITLE